MSFHSWLQNLRPALAPGRGQRHYGRRGSLRATCRLNVQSLEDRLTSSFSPITSYAVGPSPQAVATADFNNDGSLDLATANSGGNSVSVLLGDGQGGFGAVNDFAACTNPRSIVVADFNNDGNLDVATGSDRSVSALLGNGDGTFRPRIDNLASATFTLTLSRASDVDVTVHYDTADITAAAGSDYTAASGDVIIPAGQTSRTFAVAVIGDRLGEPTETFAVNLSAATNAAIGDGQGIGSILDNEPRISIGNVAKAEGRKNHTTLFTFTVTLPAAYDQAVTVSFRTVDGTATTNDGDHVGKTGTLTFAPGETTKTITIEVKGDGKREADEYFYLDLFGNSSNSLLTRTRGIGTILNDD